MLKILKSLDFTNILIVAGIKYQFKSEKHIFQYLSFLQEKVKEFLQVVYLPSQPN